MKRRELIAILTGAAALPFPAAAQQPKVPIVGVLVAGVPDPAPFLNAFREGLRGRGYVEG